MIDANLKKLSNAACNATELLCLAALAAKPATHEVRPKLCEELCVSNLRLATRGVRSV